MYALARYDTHAASTPETMAGEGETSFEMLAGEIGTQAAQLLTSRYGGRRIYLAERVVPHHPFAELMGLPAAKTLCESFGPGWIGVPLGPNSTALLRRQKVKTMSEAGYTVAAIAEALGIHTRTVERHRAAIRASAEADRRLAEAEQNAAPAKTGVYGNCY